MRGVGGPRGNEKAPTARAGASEGPGGPIAGSAARDVLKSQTPAMMSFAVNCAALLMFTPTRKTAWSAELSPFVSVKM